MIFPRTISGRSRFAAAIALALVAIALGRVIATYPVFNNTFDEPAHVLGGLEWWTTGRARLEPLHAPLPRAAVALGPYLSGLRFRPGEDPAGQEAEVLYRGGTYRRTLARARLGTLPFFLLGAWVVWKWTRRDGGLPAALLALGLFTTLPPILAHSGLATTDMAGAATLAAALFAFTEWLERPTPGRSALLGLGIGLALSAKLSAVVFFPAAALTIVVVRHLARRGSPPGSRAVARASRRAVGLAALVAFAVVWGGYRFSWGAIADPAERPHQAVDRVVGAEGRLHDLAYAAVEAPLVPAPEFLRGMNALRDKQAQGHGAYLLGRRLEGRPAWDFFPVALGVKSPPGFLLLALAGAVFLARRRWRGRDGLATAPAAAAIGILIVSLASRIDIGVRHVLSLYPLLAVTAGAGAAGLWNSGGWRRGACVALVGWQLVSTTAAHPDYLAYMNEFAAGRPDEVLVDSDLDWGQDLGRLSRTLAALGVGEISLAYFGTADPARAGLPPFRPLLPGERRTGWIAVSRTLLKLKPGYAWLDSLPPDRVIGRSIELFHLPPPPRSALGEATPVQGQKGPGGMDVGGGVPGTLGSPSRTCSRSRRPAAGNEPRVREDQPRRDA